MSNFLEVRNLDKAKQMLRGIPNGIERAVSGSINKTLSKVKTTMKRQTTHEYNILSRDIESKLSVNKATFTSLRGSIYARTPKLALSKFISSYDRKNLKVKIKRNEPAKSVEGKSELRGKPFTAIVGNMHLGIFQRKTKKRYPIKQLYTIGIAEMLGSKSVSEYTVEQGNIYLEENLEREVNRILKGYV